MRKFLSIVTSGALALLMTTTSVMTGFAYDGNNESAKATDAVSLEVVSDNTIPAEEPTGPNETVPTVPCEPTINYPQISGFSNTSTGTMITWNSYSGAVKYRIYVFNGKSWSRVGESTTTNFTHNSLRDGVTYRYTVRAMDKNNKFVSDYNKDGYSNTFFAPPVISSLQNVFGGVTVKWSKNSAIDSYRIYRKTKNTGWKRIGTSDSGSFTDTTAVSGINYTYTLRALDAENNFASYYNGGKSVTYVKAPTINKIENTVTGSKISWGKCSGASKYRVYYLQNRSWKALGNTTATSFTHNKLKSETKYTYTVRCLDSKGNFVSGYDKNGTSNTFIAPPAISKVSKAGKGNLVKWKSVPKAAGYRLYRKTVNTSWSRLADVCEGTSYTDTSAKKGNVYSYTLRCLDKKGNLISSYVDKTKYYRNGKLANGTVTVKGKKLNFDKGVLRTGMQTINGNKYYYNTSGVLQKNGIVGSDKSGWYYADKNGKIDFSYSNGITQNGKDWNVMSGKATRVKTKSDKTLFRALKVVAKVTNKSMSKSQKLKACFNYTKNAYKELNPRIPHYHGSDWPIIYANDMFVDGAGNCFSYGAAFAYMAKAIGYKNVYCCNSGGHGWAEVDGLVYDPEWSRHHARDYYALSYNTKLDQNYKAAIAAGYSWMHVKI